MLRFQEQIYKRIRVLLDKIEEKWQGFVIKQAEKPKFFSETTSEQKL